MIVRYTLGLIFAFAVGFVSKKLGVPSQSPMTIYGCVMVLCGTLGFMFG